MESIKVTRKGEKKGIKRKRKDNGITELWTGNAE
jgi:hypothetical protein